jgi:hypothetical protein
LKRCAVVTNHSKRAGYTLCPAVARQDDLCLANVGFWAVLWAMHLVAHL